MKKIIVILFALFFVGILSLSGYSYYHLAYWKYTGDNTTFEISAGEAFSSINYRLYKTGLISNPRVFHHYAKFKNILGKFKTGRYILKSNSSMTDIINQLLTGKAITVTVTIPEGKNLFEIAQILEKRNITDAESFITLAKSASLAEKFGIPGNRLEGYLYPETYHFQSNTKAYTIIESMVREFKKKTRSLNLEHPRLSPHEVIILASIVEKETGAAFERPMIAGVFHNRLKKNMRLQSDPTTIYGIFENYNGNLRKKHLLEKTPYNTYRIGGLPAGPICNPGLSSIKAVLEPADHQYLYFVSQNDGTHVFTTNYRDHRKAVEKFQKSRKHRVGKSWRQLKQKTN